MRIKLFGSQAPHAAFDVMLQQAFSGLPMKGLAMQCLGQFSARLIQAVLLVALWGGLAQIGYAETRTVAAEGKTDVCFGRELALKMAHVGADLDASNECRGLGSGWHKLKVQFPGYEQCFRCGKGEEFICKVTQAVYVCENTEKERAEKAAKEKAEQEAKRKAEQDKADQAEKLRLEIAARESRLKAEKEKADRDAKAKADKDRADKAKADKDKADKDRADKDKAAREAKIKAEKAKADQDARLKAEKNNSRSDTAGCGTAQVAGQSGHLMDSLDDMAAKPAIDKQLSDERASYRPTAVSKCTPIMNQINACYASRKCNMRSGTEVDSCVTSQCGPKPQQYYDRCTGYSGEVLQDNLALDSRAGFQRVNASVDQIAETRYLVFPTCKGWEKVENPKYEEWNRCSNAAAQCRTDTACVNSCNPAGYADQNACVNAVLAREGPSEAAVRANYNKKWEGKKSSDGGCKSGKPAAPNSGPGTVRNFMD